MTTLLHVMICYHYYKPDHDLERILDTDSALDFMTAPFRIAFTETFSEVRIRSTPSHEVTISSVKGRVARILIFASGSDRLNGTERDDFIVYYQMEIDGEVDATTARALTTNSRSALKEREAAISQASASFHPPRLAVYTGFTGHRAWISELFPNEYSGTVACISAFYFYAWILMLRIERNQLTQDITPRLRAGDKAVTEVIEQRMRLINLERYFLLGDRTNNDALRSLCIRLSEQFRLESRYQKASARHEAFENHIENTANALQAQRTASIGNMIFWLTMLSVPLAAMQVIFGINLDNAIYKQIDGLLQYTTFAVLVAAVLIVAVPVLGANLVDWFRRRLRR